MTKLTDEDRAEIARRYANKETLRLIGRDFGIPNSYVTKIGRRAGIAPRTDGPGRPPHCYMPSGHVRLLSGKVIKYTSPAEVLARNGIIEGGGLTATAAPSYRHKR